MAIPTGGEGCAAANAPKTCEKCRGSSEDARRKPRKRNDSELSMSSISSTDSVSSAGRKRMSKKKLAASVACWTLGLPVMAFVAAVTTKPQDEEDWESDFIYAPVVALGWHKDKQERKRKSSTRRQVLMDVD